MTPQETIKTMKIAIAEVEWNYPMGYAVAFENAISALEKQIPKKPKYIEGDYDMPLCPCCGMSVDENEELYCSTCGQALDWSDTNDR